MNNSRKPGVIAVIIFLAAGLMAGAWQMVYNEWRLPVASELFDCKSIETIRDEQLALAARHAVNSDQWFDHDSKAADAKLALEELGCGDASPSPEAPAAPAPEAPAPEPTPAAPAPEAPAPEPTPAAPAPEAPAPEPTLAAPTTDYTCRPTFYNNEGGKVGVYAYGRPVYSHAVSEVEKELLDRTWCDPMLMIDKAHQYEIGALGINQMSDVSRWLLAQNLAAEARQGNHDNWDQVHLELSQVLANSQNSVEELPTGSYHSQQMVPDPSGTPRVMDWYTHRDSSEDRWVLRSVLPNGKVVDNRLACGFQLQTRDDTPAPTMARAIPRDKEATPVRPKTTKPREVTPTNPPTTNPPPTNPPPTNPPTTNPPTTNPPPTNPPTTNPPPTKAPAPAKPSSRPVNNEPNPQPTSPAPQAAPLQPSTSGAAPSDGHTSSATNEGGANNGSAPNR